MAFYNLMLGIGLIFALASFWLYFLAQLFANDTYGTIHFPKDFDDLKEISNTLRAYQKERSSLVLLLFCSAYVYKQTFAIPGSVFMNILGGALFGTWRAFPLVCVLTATGATCCYLLSKTFGRRFLIQKFPDRIAKLQEKVLENNDRLFFFLLSARLFPMSPNWFLNMVSPIINIPLRLFSISVFFGLMPYNFMCVQTGAILSTVTSLDDMFSASTFFGMLLIAAVAILPGVLMKKVRKRQRSSA